ncbi:CHAT domain-containing protein [Kitasatospora sp. NPDC057015]|uniref:CHAT domain-containing protein n=1 Tax=Kitasatospora sp. NPDC057015 TaxID=3346001 RepID=UPI003636DFDA
METSISPLLDLREERAAEYERAAELFDRVDLVGEVGRCLYQAAYEYNWLGLNRPEYREKCYSTCLTAARRLGAAGDWWGEGMAEFLAGQTLRTDGIGDPPDPRNLPALRRAADAFTRANRPVEAAAAEMTAAVTLTRTDGTEWMTAAVQAMRTYELARPSLRVPKDREVNDRTIIADGARVLTGKLSRSVATLGTHPLWGELVWLLGEAPKARSFQDQQLQDDTWSRLAADDSSLSELMTRRRNLVREHSDLELMISAALMTGRSYDRIEAMEQKLRQKAEELENTDRKVAERFRRIYHDAPELTELLSTSPVTPGELQGCLDPGEAYIGYRWNDGAPLRSVVTRTSVVAGLATGVSAEFVDQAVAACREGDRIPRSNLVEPLPERIDTLVISPDALLLGLPWHSLPSPTDPDRTLGERYTISVVPAAGVLRYLRNTRSTVTAGRDTAYLGVACNGGAYQPLRFVDLEVETTERDHFADEPGSGCLVTADCDRFLQRGCDTGLLHLACHAEPHGLLLSRDGTWTRPTDLLNLPGRTFGADVLLLTGCNAGDFAKDENNEFLGVVRQLIVVTGARAAVASVAPVVDEAGVLFADLFVSALNGHGPQRPWRTPDRPLPVGPAVAWAQRTMRREVREADVLALVPDCDHPYPADPTWWSPWFVVGDPKATASGRRAT